MEEAPYYGKYGNNMYSPRYIVTSPTPTHLSHGPPPLYLVTSSPAPYIVSPAPSYQQQSSPSGSSDNGSTYYQIQPPAPGEMVIVRTTTVTRSSTSIQPIYSDH